MNFSKNEFLEIFDILLKFFAKFELGIEFSWRFPICEILDTVA